MNGSQPAGCPCCNGTDLRFLGRLPENAWFAGMRMKEPLPGGCLFLCANCGMKFRDPIPDIAMYESMYSEGAAEVWTDNVRRRDFELIGDYLRDQLPIGARVLDYGCYAGALLARLGDRFETNGVEINRAAAQAAAEVVSGRIWRALDDIPESTRFDAIVLSDVIEHVAQPYGLLAQIGKRLSPEGALLITTGDADSALWNRFGPNWWYCFYPEHIRFLSRRTLAYLSQKLGLSLVRCEVFAHSDPAPIRRTLDNAMMYWYGLFPRSYLRVAGRLAELRGRTGGAVVPGSGLSEDHLFAVMKRGANHGN